MEADKVIFIIIGFILFLINSLTASKGIFSDISNKETLSKLYFESKSLSIFKK